MPDKTFISKNAKSCPGRKVLKDRITLLLCGNASGDFLVKPMLVYKSANPRALKGVDKTTLPVYWRANQKAWVTEEVFKGWFNNCFAPELEKYLKKKNLDFKVLLLLDNAPGHPQNLTHPNIKIMFFPPNTTSLLQPMDQGIIYTFKMYYVRRSLQWILNLTESKSTDVANAWKCFSIKDCIQIISQSLKELNKSTLSGCWKKILPLDVENEPEVNLLEAATAEILNLAHSIQGEGFSDITSKDIQTLFSDPELEESELIEIVKRAESNEKENYDSSDNDDEAEGNDLTLQNLKTAFVLAKNLESFLLNCDTAFERRTKFKRDLEQCLLPYKELYKNLSNDQTKITDFFKEKSNNIESLQKRPRRIDLSSDED